MNRAQRRARARESRLRTFVHTCDFTGGIVCRICGRLVAQEEIPDLVRERLAQADDKGVQFSGDHGMNTPRPTLEEQIQAMSERVIERSLAANRIEGKAVFGRKK